MELDWTTFGLQVVNFLALVWLLKRLLYQPVMEVIGRRQQAIEASVEEARRTRSDAQALQAQLQQQVAELEQHRSQALARLGEDMAQERAQRLEHLEAELQEARERAASVAESRIQTAMAQATESAQRDALAALTRLLERLASPALDARLLDMMIEDLAHLSNEQVNALRQAAQSSGATLELSSAHPLSPADKERLCAALRPVTGCDMTVVERVDPTLTSGLRVGLGPWLLAANLSDELQFFRSGDRPGQH
jgi:F-type H+-transporting ATPase subunit b